MASKRRAGKPGDVSEIKTAIHALKQARASLKRAGATRAAAKVRSALKSAEGALRHAFNSPLEVREALHTKFGAVALGAGA